MWKKNTVQRVDRGDAESSATALGSGCKAGVHTSYFSAEFGEDVWVRDGASSRFDTTLHSWDTYTRSRKPACHSASAGQPVRCTTPVGVTDFSVRE